MNYKYGFILKEAKDYMRNVDFVHMEFLTSDLMKRFKFKTDNKRIVYIEEGVNADRTEEFVKLLEENNINVNVVSCVKWKTFPNEPQVYE